MKLQSIGHRRLSRQLASVLASQEANDVIGTALHILSERARYQSALSSPGSVRDYLRIALAGKEREEFWCTYLDAQNRVIAFESLFAGTLTQTSVYPREVVKSSLAHNAAAVIFAHNHPSGVAEPSRADEALTQSLKQALALVDIRVLDHFVVAAGGAISFAERGLI